MPIEYTPHALARTAFVFEVDTYDVSIADRDGVVTGIGLTIRTRCGNSASFVFPIEDGCAAELVTIWGHAVAVLETIVARGGRADDDATGAAARAVLDAAGSRT